MNWPSGCLTCRLIIRVLAFAVIGCCWPEGWAIVQSRDTSVALSYGNHVFTPGLFVRGCIHNLCSWTVSAELSKGLMPVQHQSIAVERSEKSRHMKPCECEYLFGILGCKFTYLFWEQKNRTNWLMFSGGFTLRLLPPQVRSPIVIVRGSVVTGWKESMVPQLVVTGHLYVRYSSSTSCPQLMFSHVKKSWTILCWSFWLLDHHSLTSHLQVEDITIDRIDPNLVVGQS